MLQMPWENYIEQNKAVSNIRGHQCYKGGEINSIPTSRNDGENAITSYGWLMAQKIRKLMPSNVVGEND